MKDNEIIKKFEEEICPRCEHYKDKDYKEKYAPKIFG